MFLMLYYIYIKLIVKWPFFQVTDCYKEWSGYNGTDVDLWVSWASWEMTGRKDYQKARDVLLRQALLSCPQTIKINKEVSLENLKQLIIKILTT